MIEIYRKTTTRTKIMFLVTIVVILFISYQFIRITTLDEIISYEQVQKLDTLNVTVDFIWQKKAFIVDDAAAVENILDILSEISIWPTYFPIEEFQTTLKNSYHIQFQYENDANIPYFDLFIYDKNALNINGKYYKILGDAELEKIYDLTILSQPENSLDTYYYDLMDSN